MKKQINIKNVSAFLMILFLSWGNFQVGGLYFYLIFQILYCCCACLYNQRKLYFSKSILINSIFILLVLSAISGVLTSLPSSFKKYSLVMTVVLMPSYFAYNYFIWDCRNNKFFFEKAIRILKIGFLIQIIYLPIQFFNYKVLDIDLNGIIFSKILHLMDNPTFYRQGEYFPSAFVWHSAVLAPMLVISFLLFKNIWIKALILLDAFICGNSTALVGVILTVIFSCIYFILKTNEKINKKFLTGIMILLLISIIFISTTKGQELLYSKVLYLINRILNVNSDSSSSAHLSYYMLYPQIVEENGWFTSLFGTGYASSGYSITNINGQYSGLRHWVVESDIIDILVSRGILGFISYYLFLFVIALKGMKIDYKYLIAIIVLIIQGITYNVQFEYVFFIELLMFGSIKLKKNFFIM